MQNEIVEGGKGAPSWSELAAAGHFEAIPAPLRWRNSASLAYLIDGYEELGSDELGRFANRQLQSSEESGIWQGNTKELWCCLFYEHRRARWTAPLVFEVAEKADGTIPAQQEALKWREKLLIEAKKHDEGSPLLHALCETLRLKLLALELNERAEIVAWVAYHAALRANKEK